MAKTLSAAYIVRKKMHLEALKGISPETQSHTDYGERHCNLCSWASPLYTGVNVDNRAIAAHFFVDGQCLTLWVH